MKNAIIAVTVAAALIGSYNMGHQKAMERYEVGYEDGCIDTVEHIQVFDDPDYPNAVCIAVSYSDSYVLKQYGIPVQQFPN